MDPGTDYLSMLPEVQPAGHSPVRLSCLRHTCPTNERDGRVDSK
jgi:hypothetical protein